MLVLAGLVGVYGGLAAGLFSSAIVVLQIVFFRTRDALAFLEGAPALRGRFIRFLAATDWHPYLAATTLVVMVVALVYGVAIRGEKRRRWRKRILTVATVGGAGVGLFYSVLFFGAITHTFPIQRGGLLALVQESPWWLVLFAPALGGLLMGLLIDKFAPDSRGHGITKVLEAIVVKNARIPARTAVFKGLTAALTTASGGSVGKEGPVVEIGSAVGSSIGQRLGVSRSQLRMLVGCGTAAGIAASFDAPIGGAMFALELILGDFGVSTFSPIVLSAVLATVVGRALYAQAQIAAGDMVLAGALAGRPREIVQTTYQLVSTFEIAPYLMLGFFCGIVSMAYIASLDRFESLFQGHWGGPVGRLLFRVPTWLKPALGGALLGALGLLVPQILGTGYETMNAALREKLGLGVTLAILGAKLIATPLTLGSGGEGGSFFPATFIGAMAGSAFGAIVHHAFPATTATSGAYALVGMGALVAGAARAPITGIVMMFEMTGDYAIILPLMVSCLTASLLVHRWLGESMYTLALAREGIDPQAGRELEALRRIPVADAMNRSFVAVPPTMSFHDLLQRLAETPLTTYVVIDDKGRYAGMVWLNDVRQFIFEESLSDVVVTGELARHDVQPILEDEDLQVALERITLTDVDHLPVVARDDPTHVVGLLSRRDILRVYRPVTPPPGELH